MNKKLAIVITHPIQYYSPVFKLLSSLVNLKVFYTWGDSVLEEKYDPGFRQVVKWDLPLLDGYNYEFLVNTSKVPGSHHFKGIINPDIIHKLEDFSPDAILVYGWAYSSHMRVIKHFHKKTTIWFRGDSNLIDQHKSWRQHLRKIFLKWIYTKVDKAFFVGTANKEYFKAYGLKDNQLVFAPHSIDNSRFSEDRSLEATKLREELGITDDEILILFAGKLELKKNPFILFEAFCQLDLPKVHLLFVGNGELEGKLKLAVKNANKRVKTRTHFLDFQNQKRMPVVYQASDLFCLPSKGPGETWGLAVNEAMAAGRAVLVSDKVGCARDLVTDKNGEKFTSEDIQDLCIKVKKLCSSRSLLLEKGKVGQRIIESWNFERQVLAYQKSLD